MTAHNMPTERSTGSRAASFRTSFDAYLRDFGTTVSIIRNTEVKDSMDRITSVTESTTTARADIQWISKQDLAHLNVGGIKIGDGMIFFEYNQDIILHDRVEFNGVRYIIIEQIEGEVVGGEVTYTGYIIRKDVQV